MDRFRFLIIRIKDWWRMKKRLHQLKRMRKNLDELKRKI